MTILNPWDDPSNPDYDGNHNGIPDAIENDPGYGGGGGTGGGDTGDTGGGYDPAQARLTHLRQEIQNLGGGRMTTGPRSPFTIAVFSPHLKHQQDIVEPVSVTVTPRWPDLGTAEITLRNDDAANQYLLGGLSRIHIAYRGEVILTGPVVDIVGDVVSGGTVTYTVEDDYRWLIRTTAWVVPMSDKALRQSQFWPGYDGVSNAPDTPGALPNGRGQMTGEKGDAAGYYDWDVEVSAGEAVGQLIRQNMDRAGRPISVAPEGDPTAATSGDAPVGYVPLNSIGGSWEQDCAALDSLPPAVRFCTVAEAVQPILDYYDHRLVIIGQSPDVVESAFTNPPPERRLALYAVKPKHWANPLTIDGGAITAGTYRITRSTGRRIILGGAGDATARHYMVVGSQGNESTANLGAGTNNYGGAYPGADDGDETYDYAWSPEVFVDASDANAEYPARATIGGIDQPFPTKLDDGKTDRQQPKWYPSDPDIGDRAKKKYRSAMLAAAHNELINSDDVAVIEVTFAETGGFHYGGGDGYHVGDTVKVMVNGVTIEDRITACEIAWANDGSLAVTPTIGTWGRTSDRQLDAIRQMARSLRRHGAGK